MKKYNITVNKDKMTINEEIGYTGNTAYEVGFSFSDEWNGMDKYITIILGENTYTEALTDNSYILPDLVKGIAYIGVFCTDNNGKRISTNLCYINIDKGAYSNGSIPEPPSADIWETYINAGNAYLEEWDNAEKARTTAETAREQAETIRKSAEENRTQTEITRNNNESLRKNNENIRQSAETARQTSEQNRVSAEENRTKAEQNRVTSETSRVNAENSRVTAEQNRLTAETARKQAENAREQEQEQFFANADNRYLPKDVVSGIAPQTEYTIESNAVNYKIYGNSIQDGTPTPTTPIEVQSVGDLVTSGEHQGEYKIETKVTGKNIIPYPYTDTTKTANGITFTDNGDGTITANGTATGTARFIFATSITIQPGTYAYSGCTGGSYSTYAMNLLNKTLITQPIIATITTPVTANAFIVVYTGTVLDNVVFKPQIELNSSTTSYEPYRESTVTTYLDEPLRSTLSTPTVADYIDYGEQKCYRNVDANNTALATPTEETITLEPMPLQNGINNILTNTITQPSNVEVTYYQNPTDVINELRNAVIALQSETE